jgi:hypothetical protein
MTTQLQPILKPDKVPPANEGRVNPLSADERLLRKAVQRVLRAQVAEVHGRLTGGAVEKGGEGSGNFGHEGRPGEVGGSGPGGGFVPDQEKLKTGAGASSEFQRALHSELYEGKVLRLYHESPIENLDSILKNGLTSGESAEGTNFATVGKPSDFITTQDKIIVRFEVPAKELNLVVPDMRYAANEGDVSPEANLLKEHHGVHGADVAFMGEVPHWRIDQITIIRGGKIESIRGAQKSFKSRSPTSAVPSNLTKWDKAMVQEVRPIWFGLFKKGGDRALKEIRRFPRHARKMAVLSWAEMQASERVEVEIKGRMVRSSSTDVYDAEDSAGSTPALPSNKAKQPSIIIPDWIEDPDVLDALEREMFKFAHGIDQTTADTLRDELMAGMEDGETISQLANRISDISDEWVEGWRSEMIARTETARAFTTGHIEAWRSTGVVSRAIWVASSDACPFCLAMDGTAVELGENFFDQGDEQTADWRGQEISIDHDYSDVNGPPLHPNCRCVLVAELDEQKMFVVKGGAGSGNFGHEGRPGEVGGSGEGGGGGVIARQISFASDITSEDKKIFFDAVNSIENALPGFRSVLSGPPEKEVPSKFSPSGVRLVGGPQLTEINVHREQGFGYGQEGSAVGSAGRPDRISISVNPTMPQEGARSYSLRDDAGVVARHEFGHVAESSLGEDYFKWTSLWERTPKHITPYAGTNEREGFAESFAAFTSRSSSVRDSLPKEIHEFFSTVVKDRIKQEAEQNKGN